MVNFEKIEQGIEDYIKTITYDFNGKTCGVPTIIWPNTEAKTQTKPYWKVAFLGATESPDYIVGAPVYRVNMQIDIVVAKWRGSREINAMQSAITECFYRGKWIGEAQVVGTATTRKFGVDGTEFRYALTIPFHFDINKPQS